uniref:Uncharacterized protein n=1 Tax=Oryza rufipogon TaxID=4529 RepID=A0A0E0RBN2_ORYRU
MSVGVESEGLRKGSRIQQYCHWLTAISPKFLMIMAKQGCPRSKGDADKNIISDFKISEIIELSTSESESTFCERMVAESERAEPSECAEYVESILFQKSVT